MTAASARLICGDVRDVLAGLPDASVQCVITSPPYYALRSYLPNGHGDKALEIGLEASLDDYIDTLVAVFRDVRRVLRDDGTCWVNIGSSYSSGRIESQEYVLRDDLADDERTYVYAELAKHFAAESQAMSAMRAAHESPESHLSDMLSRGKSQAGSLHREGV